MGLRFEGGAAHLEGHCTVEEALPLAEFFRDAPGGKAVLGACLSMHAAVFQTLMAARPTCEGGPVDARLAAALERLKGGGDAGSGDL
jgi:hypothetical protein